MLRITWDNLIARKFRLLSTSIAIVIGVAFLAGSLVLIDTIGQTFDDLFAEVNEGVDAQVRADDPVESDFGDIRGRIDESLLVEVRAVPEVRAAAGSVFGYAQLVRPNGETLGNPSQGAPTLGFSWTDVAELNPMNLVEGRPPQGSDEIAIDAKSAKDGPFSIGDEVTVLLQGPPRQFEVVGIARFGSADSPLGATVTLFDLPAAQRFLAEVGRLDTIEVVAADGISQQEVSDAIAVRMPTDIEVITGEALTEESQNDVADALSFLNTFMLSFAAVALFVASFIIFNTFSILVVQRTREMALLRALGARRRQIVGAVLIEALIVGLFASIVGFAAGVGMALLLKELFAAVGLAIPSSGLVLSAQTMWISVIVGLGVTGVSALIPSRRASTVAPMAAIRSVDVDDSGHSLARVSGGLALLGLGISLLLWGLFGDPGNRVAPIGGGVVSVFLAVAALGPIIAVPFSRLVGYPIARWRGVPGELARENVMRNPKRTSTTAAALMIGVGLVGTISIFAASAEASIGRIIDDAFIGDLVVDSGTFGFGGLSPELAAELNEIPGVQAASGVRLGFAEIDGKTRTLFGIDPATMGSIVDVGVIAGSVESLGPNDIAVFENFAEDRGWGIGDVVHAKFAETGDQELTVSVLYDRDELTGNFFIGNPAFEANFADQFDFQVYVLRTPGADPAAVRASVEAVAAGYANAEVQDLDEYKRSQAEQLNQLLNLVYALLALAVFIALLGIANTLSLSILERTRELGLLRAIGMTRRQIRSAIRWESVMISLLGTVLGAAVGLLFGWVMVRALEDEGFTELRLPIGSLLIAMIIAVVAGVLAATQPARRAAKLEILRAIGSE